MPLNCDVTILGTDDVPAARDFYAHVLSPGVTDYGGFVRLDLHGTGELALSPRGGLASAAGTRATGSGFPGYIVSYVLAQPSEVTAVVDAAATAGATVLKPPKKALFGSFAGAFRAPDGSVWKVSCEQKKDTAAPASPPKPTETGIILGVGDPKASKEFYSPLGMVVDRDYGSKYIDFAPHTGNSRLCLMRRADLAKDVGVGPWGEGFGEVVFSRDAASRNEVDALLEQAQSAGGAVLVPAAAEEWGGYSGHFADPDGYIWKVACA